MQGRTVWHETVEEMQSALDVYLLRYNRERPHQGRGMDGRTPLLGLQRRPALRPTRERETDPRQSPPEPNHPARSGHCQVYPSLYILKDDRRAILTAASHAQRAADFLLSLQPAAREEARAAGCRPHDTGELGLDRSAGRTGRESGFVR